MTTDSLRMTSQESLGAQLEEGVVSTAENSLCTSQSLDLLAAGGLADIEELEEPVTLGMKGGDVLLQGHHFFHCHLVGRLVVHQIGLQIGLGTCLLGEGGRVRRPLLCRIGHQSLVVGLGLLLLGLSLGHLLRQVLDEQIDHGDNTIALFTLLGVGTPSGRRWGGCLLGGRRCCHVVMGRDLHKGLDASACDAAWSLGGGWGATHAGEDFVLRAQLLLGRGLVELRVVKFVEPVLGKAEQLNGSAVRGHEFFVLYVLCLSLFSRLCNRLVESLDTSLESLDFLGQRCNALLGAGNGSLLLGEGAIQSLHVVVGDVKLRLAIFLLVVVIELLLLENIDQIVAHLDDLVESPLVHGTLSCESKGDKLQIRLGGARPSLELPSNQAQRLLALVGTADTDLHQTLGTWAGEGLLEQVQCIVVVQNLDGICQGHQLLSAGLGPLLPLLGLGVTVAVQSLQELLVLRHSSGRVVQVLLQVDNVNTNLAHSLCLGLDGFAVGSNFLLLGSHERIEIRDRLLLGRFRFL
mmetsp:Transcript_21364/g.31594  ORF Transcript_21364/g.31594 Transcript_21364/m.31594 type:complete len:521 (-) Transcript_21364:66-1628(-)